MTGTSAGRPPWSIRAQISTIHAFCAALLRESGHLLDLDPDFRLCDEGEGHVMMAQVLEDVLEEQYQGIDPGGGLCPSGGHPLRRTGRQPPGPDRAGCVRTDPEPPGAPALAGGAEGGVGAGGDRRCGPDSLGALLLEDAARLGRDCVRRLEQAVGLCGEDELLEQNYAPSLQTTLEQVEALCAVADRHSWDQVYACLPIPFPAVGRKREADQRAQPHGGRPGPRGRWSG